MLTLLSCLMKHTFRRCSSGIQSLEGLRAEHQIRAQTRRNENCFSSGTHKKVQICNFNTRKKDEILLQYKQSIRTQIRMPIKINIQMRGSRNSNRILFHLYTYKNTHTYTYTLKHTPTPMQLAFKQGFSQRKIAFNVTLTHRWVCLRLAKGCEFPACRPT